MSTRSLIGVLDADGRSFRARYCHNNGYPEWQVPHLAAALHDFRDGDTHRLTTELLSQEWSAIDPAAASAECGDQPELSNELRVGLARPSHIQPHAGVGYHYTDIDPTEEPLEGHLGEQPDIAYEWLYLFTGDELLLVFSNEPTEHGRQWAPFRDFPVRELPNLDPDEITQRRHALR